MYEQQLHHTIPVTFKHCEKRIVQNTEKNKTLFKHAAVY